MGFNSQIDKSSLHCDRLNGMMRTMNKRRAVIFSILLFFITMQVFAFQFSPLEQEFASSGANSTKTYTIVNDSNDTIAIEITALVRDLDVNGKEVNKSASTMFSIVPSKILMKPQSQQIVRVQYRGPQMLPTEAAYRIRAEQLSYTQGRATEGQSMFNFLYVYTTSAYVSPTRVLERIVVDQVTPKITSDGQKVIAITVSNTGTVHQILNSVSVEVIENASRNSILYESGALGFLNGLNLLAGKTVTVEAVWPDTLAFPTKLTDAYKQYSAKITYNK